MRRRDGAKTRGRMLAYILRSVHPALQARTTLCWVSRPPAPSAETRFLKADSARENIAVTDRRGIRHPQVKMSLLGSRRIGGNCRNDLRHFELHFQIRWCARLRQNHAASDVPALVHDGSVEVHGAKGDHLLKRGLRREVAAEWHRVLSTGKSDCGDAALEALVIHLALQVPAQHPIPELSQFVLVEGRLLGALSRARKRAAQRRAARKPNHPPCLASGSSTSAPTIAGATGVSGTKRRTIGQHRPYVRISAPSAAPWRMCITRGASSALTRGNDATTILGR